MPPSLRQNGLPDAPGPGAISLTLQSSHEEVRATLQKLRGRLAEAGQDMEMIARVELVLAEVLNNVVEHAYCERPDGPIRLTVEIDDHGLRCRVADRGRPMKGGALPDGRMADLPSGSIDTLPEGGFGWSLIHTLTTALDYRREAGENRLILEFGRKE